MSEDYDLDYFTKPIRRTFRERLWNWLVPPTPYEAEYRRLLEAQAWRTAVRTDLQKRRAAEREARRPPPRLVARVRVKAYLPKDQEEIIVQADLRATHLGQRECVVTGVLKADRMRRLAGYDSAGADYLRDQKVYVQHIKPWLDGVLSDAALAKGVRNSKNWDLPAVAR